LLYRARAGRFDIVDESELVLVAVDASRSRRPKRQRAEGQPAGGAVVDR